MHKQTKIINTVVVGLVACFQWVAQTYFKPSEVRTQLLYDYMYRLKKVVRKS